MPEVKISALPAAGTLDGTEVVPVVQAGVTRKLALRRGTTASRPTASSAGAGAQFYDTTLTKPIWSDGTVWRDSAGTAV